MPLVFHCRLLVIAVLWLINAQALADTPEQPTQAAQESQETQESPATKDAEEATNGWLDVMQSGVEGTVDNTARWFDDFFGDPRTFEDSYNSQGRVSIAPEWSEYDGWELDSSFRARFNLPNTERRFSAIIGRVDQDDYVTGDDTERRTSILTRQSGDSEWLVGLGFNPEQGEASRFSFNVGIRGGLKADLYTEGRYLWQKRLGDSFQVRTRSSLFWRDSDGYGGAQRVDFEVSMGPNWLSRLTVDATSAERIQGTRWRNIASLYHLYDEEKALLGQVWWFAESKAPVSVSDTGFRLAHRRNHAREWLYIEVWAGMHWPRRELGQAREGAWLAGLQFEMWYGESY